MLKGTNSYCTRSILNTPRKEGKNVVLDLFHISTTHIKFKMLNQFLIIAETNPPSVRNTNLKAQLVYPYRLLVHSCYYRKQN